MALKETEPEALKKLVAPPSLLRSALWNVPILYLIDHIDEPIIHGQRAMLRRSFLRSFHLASLKLGLTTDVFLNITSHTIRLHFWQMRSDFPIGGSSLTLLTMHSSFVKMRSRQEFALPGILLSHARADTTTVLPPIQQRILRLQTATHIPVNPGQVEVPAYRQILTIDRCRPSQQAKQLMIVFVY